MSKVARPQLPASPLQASEQPASQPPAGPPPPPTPAASPPPPPTSSTPPATPSPTPPATPSTTPPPPPPLPSPHLASPPPTPPVPAPPSPPTPAPTSIEASGAATVDGPSAHEPPPTYAYGVHSFTPLRSEPPPKLFATWWLRYLLVLSLLVGIVVAVLREYAVPGGMDATFVVVPHVMAAVMLVGWSAFAMLDAARLVPATRYQHQSRAWVAVVLWLGAFAAPVIAYSVIDGVREQFADGGDDVLPIVVGTGTVLACFVLVWLPFRYHVRQAHRIGAPVGVVAAWFWLPLVTVVGVLAVTALGLHDTLADEGFTDLERSIQVGVLYGIPALMFALSTWRATTVFDEVIELRWMRWRTEWEQTLAAFAAQPAPGPEASPVIDTDGMH